MCRNHNPITGHQPAAVNPIILQPMNWYKSIGYQSPSGNYQPGNVRESLYVPRQDARRESIPISAYKPAIKYN
ncbi:hypothetical protein HZB00_01755 [Candidatus Woesearchaeota archaeon]|nr:hypothetical protein [Candidatus Woesearchaeota archaeon]